MALTAPDQAVPIRDAATVVLVRDVETTPRLLMGQRGKAAVFMPSKFVFPGGAVDAADAEISVGGLDATSAARLRNQSDTMAPNRFAVAAIRELWEETGQCLGTAGNWDAPDGWQGFADKGLKPDASALKFFFRALTPVGRPRRFDARFFLADATALATDPDDFSEAEDELSHLHWVTLSDVWDLDLPFITRLVLGEVQKHLPRTDGPDAVPYVKNDELDSNVIWL